MLRGAFRVTQLDLVLARRELLFERREPCLESLEVRFARGEFRSSLLLDTGGSGCEALEICRSVDNEIECGDRAARL
jgi:hypothetical protein